MIRNAFSLFVVFTLVMGVLLFAGCPTDPPPDRGDAFNSGLIGTWNSGTDGYVITASTINYNDSRR
ncbi:hypothetical protein AGMMS50268_12260 [Spirochaetia bacterium]|nr:hypothetical protein AGMMS50268_12260 [Spirochaetia bacterium]